MRHPASQGASHFLGLLIAYSLLAGASRGADDGIEDALGFSRAPYLQLATPSGMHIVWRTVGPMAPVVRLGEKIDDLSVQVSADQISVRTVAASEAALKDSPQLLHSGPERTRQFEAELTGLLPDTTYYYAIYDGKRRLTPEKPGYRFRTLPLPGRAKDAFFWVLGDSGTGEERQAEVYQAMLDYTTKLERPIDFYLHVGDMAYEEGKDGQFQRNFFRVYERTLRRCVVWPAMGNHEGITANGLTGAGPYYDAYVCPTRGQAGGVPSGHESYYAFDYGNIHFIVLNSFDVDRTGGGAMAAWLREDLAQVRSDWLIAYWHHPLYSKGSHDTDIEEDSTQLRRYILPLLESHGVDLILTGHSHIYERSMLMDGAYGTPTRAPGAILDDGDGDPKRDGAYRKLPGLQPNQGMVHLVAGHGGTHVERMGTMPVMKRVIVEHGSVLISIRGNVLDAVMIDYTGKERDRFQIRKEGGVLVARVQDPILLPPYAPPGEDLPPHYVEIIPPKDHWAYFMGEDDPPKNWAHLQFDDTSWHRAPAGFGYNDEDDETILEALSRTHDGLYIRHPFTLPKETQLKELGLGIRYDDAFIVYVNGAEVLRQGVGSGHGSTAKDIAEHEAGEQYEYFSLSQAETHIKKTGPNVIAIEAHSIGFGEGDFTLNPFLIESLDPYRVNGVQPPLVVTTPQVPASAHWSYSLSQDFEDGWKDPGFDDAAWRRDRMPMGYGKNYRVNTRLEEMPDRGARVRFRREIDIANDGDIDRLGLMVVWDDGFIAYANGRELGRGLVARGAGVRAVGIGKTGPSVQRYFPLSLAKEHVKSGRNVIAIEGHNNAPDSSDYFMAPSIQRHWPVFGSAPPEDFTQVIPAKAEWEFLAGRDPEDRLWTTGRGWKKSRAPFGYGYRDLETVLENMQDWFERLYLRRHFQINAEDEKTGLGLLIAWDDAFIAYLNGKEFARVGIESGRGKDAEGLYRVRGAKYRFFPLGGFKSHLKSGANTMAVEGHNRGASSSDFLLDVRLIRVMPRIKELSLPKDIIEIIPQRAPWRYLGGKKPPDGWTTVTFDDSHWLTGNAAFGHGRGHHGTRLAMKYRYTNVYIRKTFDLTDPPIIPRLGLGMRWDDGFIAYINGQEVIRRPLKWGRGGRAQGTRRRAAQDDYTAFRLKPFAAHLKEGLNVIAIEGHKRRKDGRPFTLDPFLFASDWNE